MNLKEKNTWSDAQENPNRRLVETMKTSCIWKCKFSKDRKTTEGDSRWQEDGIGKSNNATRMKTFKRGINQAGDKTSEFDSRESRLNK